MAFAERRLRDAGFGTVGDLDRILCCVRTRGLVSCAAGRHQQSAVVSEASDLIAKALGEPGRHVRAAAGCRVLPLDAAMEVEAVSCS